MLNWGVQVKHGGADCGYGGTGADLGEQHGGCSLVTNDEFSNTFLEQRTLDAIGVLIISTTVGGGAIG